MSGDVVGLVTVCLTILTILLGFVWKAAVTATSHDHRLTELEKDSTALSTICKELNRSVVKLDKHLAVNEAAEHGRSQGQFDNSDRPPGG
jgi:hypothetical protein